ncbi:hypothetical protein [Rubrivirga sp.]|uniref:hypothetical protein n=1 Tax=Rubrivirga sp. TaxID=1885344 RepID=UPI003B51FE02
MTRFSFRPLALALGAAFLFSACDATLDPADSAPADLTEAEIADATQIVAEALAEDTGGFVASARDLTASVSDGGMAWGPRGARVDAPCRNDYRLTYNATTGTHVVSYQCNVETDVVKKHYAVRIGYQYRDAAGGFVPRPVAMWDTVDTVRFEGTRNGSVTLRRDSVRWSQSTFEQDGRWALSQLADDATPALLSGRQTRTGTRARVTPDGSASRSYTITLSGEDIQLREGDGGLTPTASGELAYTLTVEVTRNGETQTREVEGVVELEGNGRALLRIFGLRGVYRVSLADGETDRSA